jgi:hypothetical protein
MFIAMMVFASVSDGVPLTKVERSDLLQAVRNRVAALENCAFN